MPTLADLLRTPGTPANPVKTTLADLFRGYNREAVAGMLGAPVDMANTVSNLTRAGIGYTGHKLGLLATPPDLIEKPALGSDWIYERLPNQPALTGSGAENTGRMLGALLSPPVVMQAAPATVRALGRALQEKVPGMAENYLRTIGGLKDIDVWHGSPYKFDKFDPSKIGTGEGKQQQGIGTYLADRSVVGQKYADKESLRRGLDSGYLYKVDLPENLIARMADYDFDLRAQPDSVRNAVRSLIGPEEVRALRSYHGWDAVENAPFAAVLDAIEIARSNNRFSSAQALRALGVPGIRYLDGGSRGAGTGTRNYVIFPGEEHNLRILERNGVPIK